MSSKSKKVSIRDTLHNEFPFRTVQVNTLCNLLVEDDIVLPPCIFIHGLPSTGKTSLITRLLYLIRNSVKSAIVNSVCCYTNRFLFEPILKCLLQNNQSNLPNRCDNFMQFLNILKQAKIQNERVIIVLDNCEMLEHEQILIFSKLQELLKSYQFCVILITQVSPTKFGEDIDFIPIVFEQYNSAEISTILSIDKPSECNNMEVYKNFLTVFIGSFYGSCRDLVELKHLAKLLFSKYVEPIQNGSCAEFNQNLLFRKISPTIQILLNSVYLGPSLESVDSLLNEKTKFERHALDLPYYAKYFLIAAYIASFNSPKYDRQLFVKASNKRKKSKPPKLSENSTSELVGPKIFSLDRLLAIFYAIIEENTNMTANLLAQVNTLADLGLLIRLGDGKLETPKYKCSVNFDCVDNIARTVKFNINKYLIDK